MRSYALVTRARSESISARGISIATAGDVVWADRRAGERDASQAAVIEIEKMNITHNTRELRIGCLLVSGGLSLACCCALRR
jgi:hypothetical protein